MNQNEAISYLLSLASRGWKLGLEKITLLLGELDNPHTQYPTIHIAGTNGKGSTSAMIESILRAAGYRTGLYTSPHLVEMGERIRLNGQSISRLELSSYINRLQPLFEKYGCTFFEAMTVIALLYFAEQKVSIAVIEVGLGGRLDATNVITPWISIITRIDIDHTKQLGKTRRQIALEKAGIIKPGTICITQNQAEDVSQVFAQVCQMREAEHFLVTDLVQIEQVRLGETFSTFDATVLDVAYPQLTLALIGEHQLENAALALATIGKLNARFLRVEKQHVYDGLRRVSWPGRLQVIADHPKVILDVAHNPNGIATLTQAVRTIFDYQRLIAVFGVCRDKDYRRMVQGLAAIADSLIAVKAETDRGLSAQTLARVATRYLTSVHDSQSIDDGFRLALTKAKPQDLILVTGSHYVVGRVLESYLPSIR
ncbi:MAG: bifunctional folylpolyglutamate synthase/dihydrofolate synthase [candidate division KSB1 bacterium]|nr:bifunctional folylpolyglutamate synthase/dihydrofolate synthase [candidate division KSB1 bacterium]MDZ7317711.1 bifunctional folylpolyglutamate synthase/dihydrofolate synthase [candidate division KSB1 bacterium]MDZ7341858.1 bifunctional folylpolyglutamate synthase/dihydrofolate synthase [candidate division KSB1 bacterium]